MTPQFGKYIRTLRTEHGLTQAALAAKLHVTDKAVSKWERDLSYPDISLLSIPA
jgi:transcriptional regulator with XRE-family HTH domain